MPMWRELLFRRRRGGAPAAFATRWKYPSWAPQLLTVLRGFWLHLASLLKTFLAGRGSFEGFWDIESFGLQENYLLAIEYWFRGSLEKLRGFFCWLLYILRDVRWLGNWKRFETLWKQSWSLYFLIGVEFLLSSKHVAWENRRFGIIYAIWKFSFSITSRRARV